MYGRALAARSCALCDLIVAEEVDTRSSTTVQACLLYKGPPGPLFCVDTLPKPPHVPYTPAGLFKNPLFCPACADMFLSCSPALGIEAIGLPRAVDDLLFDEVL